MHTVRTGIIGVVFGTCMLAVGVGFGGDGVTGDPLPQLTAEERAMFDAGRAAFAEVEGADEGLGPFFNAASCAECHAHPTVGGVAPPTRPELRELRIGRYLANGAFDALLDRGGPVLHRRGLGDLAAAETDRLPPACRDVRGTVTPPPEAQVTSIRVTTPLFGLGLVEAIPAEEIVKRVGTVPGVSGKAQYVGTDVGRFGWKAQHASLMAFAGEAYLIEMGITNPLAPREAHALRRDAGGAAARACDTVAELEDEGNDVFRFTNFMRFLAPPPRGPITAQVQQGETLFKRAGCDACHVPALQTGPSPIAALDRKPVPAYSDFLLHDIGTGDGVPQGNATGGQFRTAPLWGLRFRPFLLHDGRTGDVLEAVRAHGGEARSAADTVFKRFDAGDRAALREFLKSL